MRVPVPFVFVLAFLFGSGLQQLLPIGVGPAAALRFVHAAGLGLLTVGVALAAWCLLIFQRQRTTTIPFETASRLVTWGPYRVSRNPMYVSLTLAYIGEAGLLAQAWTLVPLALTIAYLDRVVIPYEESRLQAAFGATYEEYRSRVGRWIRLK